MTPVIQHKEFCTRDRCEDRFTDLIQDVAVLNTKMEGIGDDIKEIKDTLLNQKKKTSVLTKIVIGLVLAGSGGAGVVELIKTLI